MVLYDKEVNRKQFRKASIFIDVILQIPFNKQEAK